MIGRPVHVVFALATVTALTALALSPASAAPAAADASPDVEGFKQVVQPFLQKYCVGCHGPKKQKAKLAVHTLGGDVILGKSAETWTKVLDQLTLREMPPEDEPQPDAKTRQRVMDWVRAELRKGGKSADSKLHRRGYGNYVPHDVLFGSNKVGVSSSPPRLWRIRPAVYQASIQQVAKGKYTAPFTLKSAGHGFRDYGNLYQLAGPDLSQLITNAAAASGLLAEVVVKDGKANRGRQTPDQLFRLVHPDNKQPTDEQFTQAVEWLYHRVLLRDPTAEERDRLIAFAKASIERNGRLLGVRNMVAAVLLNPEALYRSERGAGKPDEHGRVMLSPRELAYAIAYALTDSRPDAELLKAADTGKLASREDVERQVRRILDSEKILKPRILGFFREYFEYGGAVDVFKDPELFRSHSPGPLVRDTDYLVLYFYERDKDVLRELLTSRLSFVQYDEQKGKPIKASRGKVGDGRVHLSYNLPLDWKWVPDQPIELPGEQRAGVLTQPSWLVAKSDNFDNHAILRGMWVRQKLLGGTIPDVPITVDAQLPNEPTWTLRERMKVTRETYCWSCHSKMNPLGLTFEQFDHFGRWRTRELGEPVVTTGVLDRSGEPGLDADLDNAVELVHKLAGSQRVRQVFVRHAFRYWMGRNETPTDAATLRRADKAYVDAGGSMKAMIVSLLTSDSFLYRTVPTAQSE